jgi:hypothetical protein
MENVMFTKIILAALISTTAGVSAQAQSCDMEPQFASHRTSNTTIRAQHRAAREGEWAQVIHFGQSVIDSGVSVRHKGAALTNSCAGYAMSGDMNMAGTTCDSAVEMNANSWQAINNRGAAHWLNGDYTSARSDFTAAAALGTGEDEVLANSSLAQCSTAR